MIESKSNVVVDFFVAEKSMTEYSSKMEPLATKARLTKKQKENQPSLVPVTPCHTQHSLPFLRLIYHWTILKPSCVNKRNQKNSGKDVSTGR
jgi:ribosomal protein L39E